MAYDSKKVSAWLSERSYCDKAIADGLAYASAHGATTDEEAASLAMARILYMDEQLEGGAKFEVESLDD